MVNTIENINTVILKLSIQSQMQYPLKEEVLNIMKRISYNICVFLYMRIYESILTGDHQSRSSFYTKDLDMISCLYSRMGKSEGYISLHTLPYFYRCDRYIYIDIIESMDVVPFIKEYVRFHRYAIRKIISFFKYKGELNVDNWRRKIGISKSNNFTNGDDNDPMKISNLVESLSVGFTEADRSTMREIMETKNRTFVDRFSFFKEMIIYIRKKFHVYTLLLPLPLINEIFGMS